MFLIYYSTVERCARVCYFSLKNKKQNPMRIFSFSDFIKLAVNTSRGRGRESRYSLENLYKIKVGDLNNFIKPMIYSISWGYSFIITLKDTLINFNIL